AYLVADVVSRSDSVACLEQCHDPLVSAFRAERCRGHPIVVPVVARARGSRVAACTAATAHAAAGCRPGIYGFGTVAAAGTTPELVALRRFRLGSRRDACL